MKKFMNLIEAVKAIREMAGKVNIEKNEATGRFEIRSAYGLKDSKDLAEAIMALGVRRFLETNAKRTDAQLVSMWVNEPVSSNESASKWCQHGYPTSQCPICK